MQGFGEDFKELVRSSTNLVDLVSEIVSLKPQHGGRQYVGLCPFHDDHNPSFFVYPDRQSYRCWVCDQGGDCFRWVMETEKVTFPEAIERLAQKARLEIPKRARTSETNGPSRIDTLSVVEWAANLMHTALRTSEQAAHAREYVRKRKLTEDTVRSFRLGYHPENRQWFLDKARGKYSPAQLIAAGLIREREGGFGYSGIDLVDRLVFPIFDERGRVVAFGGRVLPGRNDTDRGKYWNSQESAIFQKRRMMYAFDRARDAIRRSRTAIIVEGYMDCIACHQAGVANAVATLGTAMTDEHVRFLRRFAEKVVLVFDSDDAGQRAAERAISQFGAQDLDLRILNVPSGKDPADYLEEHTREDFLKLTESASEAWEYKLQSVLKRSGTSTVAGRQQVLNQMIDFLATAQGMSGSVREDLILRNVCWRIQVDERVARQQLQDIRNRTQKTQSFRRVPEKTAVPVVRTAPVQNAMERAERELLEIILTCPETIEIVRHQIGVDDFENPRHQRLLALCIDVWKEDGDLPEPGRMIIAADSDSDLLSLMNAVVDSAEEKGINQLMSEQPSRPEQNGGIPPHLEKVLGPLLERREKRLNLVSKQILAQATQSPSELNDDTRDALRRLYNFRQSQMGHPSSLK